jgi:hypothetical protein
VFFCLFIHLFTLFGPFLPLPLPHSLPGRTCSTLISNFVEE